MSISASGKSVSEMEPPEPSCLVASAIHSGKARTGTGGRGGGLSSDVMVLRIPAQSCLVGFSTWYIGARDDLDNKISEITAAAVSTGSHDKV